MIVVLTEPSPTKPTTLVGVFTNQLATEDGLGEYLEHNPDAQFMIFENIQQNHIMLTDTYWSRRC